MVGLRGCFSERIESFRTRILDFLAEIEAQIDFAAEDGIMETANPDPGAIGRLAGELTALAVTYKRGKISREGLNLVIAGRPNVGKSSLFNCLLGEKRAIVTDQPGTTRDFIEEAVELGGIALRLSDTAGIHSTTDAIEKAGIDLVWERLKKADAVLVLFDGSQPISAADRELLAEIPDMPLLAVINKADLPRRLDQESLRASLPAATAASIVISVKYGDGIENLKKAILALLPQIPDTEGEALLVTHLRHCQAIKQAGAALNRARQALEAHLPPELPAIDIREAADSLGEITGRATPEEVLDRIFSRFCIGK
ncbi:MAG: GTP-binding protein [Syntrophaceae bacterium]|nr:GTP-binding protein [Syntrophaceae bacterium]